ncbi:hypothetical protein AB0B94_27715 [Micromonospora sp. NPDC048986]|uniref:hypothetical protein n=1 Tax=Micromonospora sp. NPDC048986 TaxID=3155644 RepID=UPI0033C3E61C
MARWQEPPGFGKRLLTALAVALVVTMGLAVAVNFVGLSRTGVLISYAVIGIVCGVAVLFVAFRSQGRPTNRK